jgi:hypothetical protein
MNKWIIVTERSHTGARIWTLNLNYVLQIWKFDVLTWTLQHLFHGIWGSCLSTISITIEGPRFDPSRSQGPWDLGRHFPLAGVARYEWGRGRGRGRLIFLRERDSRLSLQLSKPRPDSNAGSGCVAHRYEALFGSRKPFSSTSSFCKTSQSPEFSWADGPWQSNNIQWDRFILSYKMLGKNKRQYKSSCFVRDSAVIEFNTLGKTKTTEHVV